MTIICVSLFVFEWEKCVIPITNWKETIIYALSKRPELITSLFQLDFIKGHHNNLRKIFL